MRPLENTSDVEAPAVLVDLGALGIPAAQVDDQVLAPEHAVEAMGYVHENALRVEDLARDVVPGECGVSVPSFPSLMISLFGRQKGDGFVLGEVVEHEEKHDGINAERE